MQDTLSFGSFQISRRQRLLLDSGTPVKLSQRAFDLLVALTQRAGEVISGDELVAIAWPDVTVAQVALRVHISSLRRALGDDGSDKRYIVNVPGRGYSFVAPVTPTAEQSVAHPVIAAAPPTRTHNLPTLRLPMIGRDTSVRALQSKLQQRLVTVVGAGGIGKTTVAIATAEALAANYDNGAVFVNLAPLTDPLLVPNALASAVGVTLQSDDAVQDIMAGLKTMRMLLVLDNCEHVVETVAHLAETLLSGAPGIHILATSREPLRCKGEWVQRLQPLAVPPSGATLTAADALGFSAVRLFAERAMASASSFEMHDDDVATVTDICRRLDGIPLALELAAASMEHFGLHGMAAHLDNRFRVLTRGLRTALPRQRTLRATLDWSYEMLPAVEQVILRRLAILRGAFTLDTARAVASGSSISEMQITSGVGRLVAKSLVVADLSGERATYRLLETTRAYGLEKLSDSGERDAMARLHAEHVCGLMQQSEDGRPRGLIDDVSAALEWAFSPHGDGATGVALTLQAIPLWIEMSLVQECRRRVEQAIGSLDRSTGAGGRNELQLLIALATAMQNGTGPGEANTRLWQRANDLTERLGDADFQLRTLWGLWIDCRNNGEHRKGLQVAQRFQTLASLRNAADDTLVADRMVGMSLFVLGELSDARKHVERMLAHYVESSRASHMVRFHFEQRAGAEFLLAMILCMQGMPGGARDLIDTGLAEVEAAGHAMQVTVLLAQFACPIACLIGDLDRMGSYIVRLLECTERHGLAAWTARARCWQALARIRQGEGVGAIAALDHALQGFPGDGRAFQHVWFLGELALAQADAGRAEAAHNSIELAIQRAELGGELWCVPELLRIRGHVLISLGSSAEAEAAFTQSLSLARRQGALSWELRTATSLARHWFKAGRRAEAGALLVPLHSRFDTNDVTGDMRAAEELLSAFNAAQ